MAEAKLPNQLQSPPACAKLNVLWVQNGGEVVPSTGHEGAGVIADNNTTPTGVRSFADCSIRVDFHPSSRRRTPALRHRWGIRCLLLLARTPFRQELDHPLRHIIWTLDLLSLACVISRKPHMIERHKSCLNHLPFPATAETWTEAHGEIG